MKFTAKAVLVLLLAVWTSVPANADTLYVSLTDQSFEGVAMFGQTLGFINQINVGHPSNGIAAGEAGEFYLGSGSTIYRYQDDGTVISSVSGSPTTQIRDVSYGNSRVYVGLTDQSFNGVAQFTMTLGLISQPATNRTDGLAAGGIGEFYLGSSNTIYRYGDAGNVIGSVSGSGTTQIRDVAFSDTNVFVALTDQSFYGVAIFNSNLGLIHQLQVQGPVDGLAAGRNGEFYIGVANTIYRYDSGGNILGSISGSGTTRITSMSYFRTPPPPTPTPEPAQLLTFGIGIALLLWSKPGKRQSGRS